ncbi:AIPR family protein [Listeria booriae]|uniref:AIPR family protein n=1 Tax=Listeria booriae TaxID=1552123 RepID=UPI001627C48A|nr:AIPR family protein [Listeria booriae]MBC2322812.1 AIPR family protein [Listeria booriae]
MGAKAKQKDYDLVEKISLNYAHNVGIENEELSQKDIARLGFYYLSLELLLGIQDLNELSEMIIDSSYQAKVNNVSNIDFGIDAVYIDEDIKKIYLFSFKYRDGFKSGDTKTPAELQSTTPFLGYIKNENRFFNDLGKNSDRQLSIDKINDILDFKAKASDFVCELHMVTNDCGKLDQDAPSVSAFTDIYPWLIVKEFNLNDLARELSIKAENNNAEIILSKKELLQHDMDGYTTANSYVGKVKLTDLIKISSKDHTLRKKEHIDDATIILDQYVDLNVLFDNVRGFLGGTSYNEKIISTLEKEPEKFFLFNNGITITADDIIVTPIKMDEHYRIELVNYQIVNGGQTLRSIYHFKDTKPNFVTNLAKGSVLIRFFKTGLEDGLVNKVSEYTNSQNAISGRDLKSVDKIQLDIEQRFGYEDIKYLRKRTKDSFEKKHSIEISMEKLGQLILAYNGHPEKVSNSKKKIFNEYYNLIFNDDPNFMDRAIKLAQDYHKIVSEYSNLKEQYSFYEQKVFYIIYLNKCLENNSISDSIIILEEALSNFREKDELSPARKLIQTAFKTSLDNRIKKQGGKLVEAIPLKKITKKAVSANK